MRDIKFRGKDFDSNWVFGCYVKYLSQAYIYVVNGTDIESIAVIPNTVGQFTGLHDKNGVEIYEGDVVKIPYNNFGNKIVEHLDKELCWNISNYNPLKIYVIGNIHERSEDNDK